MKNKQDGDAQGGYGHDQMPSNGMRDPDGHQSGSRKLSMQCCVLRAHSLPDLPNQSRMVRQGSLALRAEPNLENNEYVLCRSIEPLIRVNALDAASAVIGIAHCRKRTMAED
jgi:hypothetical protein